MAKKPQPPGDRSNVPLVELLEFAIEQANDGIAIMRFTGDVDVPIRIVYANETIERLSGYTREELLHPSNPFLQVQPQTRAVYEAHFVEIRAGKQVRFEVELGGKDRSTWMDIRWSPLRYRAGAVTHYVAVLRDITERRRVQAEHELLYRAIEQAHDGICILEFPGGEFQRRYVSYANDAVCEMFKLSREQILTEGLAQRVFPDSPGLLARAIAEVSRGATFEHEVRVRRGDDTLRWLHLTASSFFVEGERIGRLTVTYRDIEDRKRNEEQLTLLQSILSETSDFIVIASATRPSEGGPKVTYANPAFAELVGLKTDRVVGRGLLEFLSSRNDGKLVAGVISRLERHQSIANELLLRRVDDGSDVWIELTGHEVRGEGGRPVSWFLIGKDISVRKQSYAQTVQLMTALDLAEEPIAIYGVIKPHELEIQHMNERATAFDRLLFENVLLDPSQREWIESIWPALEKGWSVNRLMRAPENDSRRWVTLEIRPLGTGSGSLTSIIAIEHGLRFGMYDGQSDGVGTALALSREILHYADLDARRDAFLEALREEWCATGSFRLTDEVADVVFRMKERSGFAVMPGGVLFEQPTAVDFAWSGEGPPRRLIALRLFLETLANSD
jgi:PAS domain S-box-containing protein